jgi:hypothetical protein
VAGQGSATVNQTRRENLSAAMSSAPLQERPLGGLSKSIIRKLERLNLDSEASDAQRPLSVPHNCRP